MNLIDKRIELPTVLPLAAEAIESRGELVARAQQIESVADANELSLATDVGVTLQRHIKDVESARETLAKPVNTLAKQLIKIERDYIKPLLDQKDRIGRLVTAFKSAERLRVEKEERERQEEIQRLERIRLEAEAKADRARTDAGKVKAEMAAYNAQQAQQDVIRAPLPAVTKARGQATREKLCFRVVDARKVYAVRPELCEVTVKASAVQAVCQATDKIDGLELWTEDVTSFRS